MNRDDRVHGALLILNELVRISSMEGEVSAEFVVITFSLPQVELSFHCLVSVAANARGDGGDHTAATGP